MANLLDATSGTTSSARCTSSASTRSTSTTRPRLAPRVERRAGLAALLRGARQSALTGPYDIIAHPDLVKVWGSGRPRLEGPAFYYEPAFEAMLEAGVAMEVSTAGLRKPVGEIYPARAMLEMAVDAASPSRCRATRTRPTTWPSATRRRSSC